MGQEEKAQDYGCEDGIKVIHVAHPAYGLYANHNISECSAANGSHHGDDCDPDDIEFFGCCGGNTTDCKYEGPDELENVDEV